MNENDTPKKLTPRQKLALATLLAGGTHEDAAAAANVATKTVQRWHDLPHFETELRRRSQQSVQNATRRLSGTLDTAVDVMREVMTDTDEPASVRLRAANYVVQAALKLNELDQLVERVEEALDRLALLENSK